MELCFKTTRDILLKQHV